MVAFIKKFVFWPFLLFGVLEAVQVYENTLPIESDTTVSGLKYRREFNNQNIDWNNGFTVCTRFNLKKLSQYVFYLGRRDLVAFHFTINYILGGDANRPSQGRIILEKDKKRIFYIPWFDHDPNDAEYVAVNIWHHVCISWEFTNSKISLVVVSKFHFDFVFR